RDSGVANAPLAALVRAVRSCRQRAPGSDAGAHGDPRGTSGRSRSRPNPHQPGQRRRGEPESRRRADRRRAAGRAGDRPVADDGAARPGRGAQPPRPSYKPVPENNIYYYTYVQESTALRAIQAASNGIQMLASGFTIVRDMGNNALYADTALRQAIEQGWIPGPTIINSGIIIGGMGGQFFPTPEMAKDHNIVYPEYLDADTPD